MSKVNAVGRFNHEVHDMRITATFINLTTSVKHNRPTFEQTLINNGVKSCVKCVKCVCKPAV